MVYTGKVPDAFTTTFQNAINGARALFNKFIDWLNEKMKFQWDGVEIAGQTVIEGGSFQLFKIPNIPAFAAGGYPNTGEMFLARESGPKLVGRISNRTAVANNDQITSAIKNAVIEGMLEVSTTLGGGEKEIHIHLEGEAAGLFKLVKDKNNEYIKINKKSAFEY